MSCAIVPGLIFIFKNIIFCIVFTKTYPSLTKESCQIPEPHYYLGQIRESTPNYLGTTIVLKFSASAHRATGRLGDPLN
jgi:hypothetical protein